MQKIFKFQSSSAKILLSFTFLLLFANFAKAQNSWPHIRGQQYNGHADNESLNIIPNQKFPILWQVKLGQGYSGCVVVGEKVFTQAQSRSGQYIICLDANTGDERWRTHYGWPWELKGQYPGTYSTPTYYKGKIYFTGCYGTIGCLDSITGKKIWLRDLQKDFKIQMPSFGYACTPLLDANTMYLTLGEDGGAAMALKAETGELIWKRGNDPASYSSPIIIEVSGQKQLICFLENMLVAYNPKNGKELWQQTISEGYDEHSTWPVFESPLIFCSSPFFRNAHVLKLSYQEGKAVKTPVWQNKLISNDIFSSVIVNGYIYGFHIEEAQANPISKTDGRLKCLDLKTGKELWSSQKPGHVNILAVKDKLILFSDTGKLSIIKTEPTNYIEITHQSLFENVECWTLPAILNGKLYIRGGKDLICLDLNSTFTGENPTNIATKKIKDRIENWLHQYHGDAYVSPSYYHMWLWYLSSIIIIAFSAHLAWIMRRKFKKNNWFFCFFTIALALIGPILFAPLAGEFVFTWPLALFTLFMSILNIRASSIKKAGKGHLLSRFSLVSFILVCVGYYQLCHALFIISGIGFLVGLFPATPFGILITRYSDSKLSIKYIFAWTVVFSIFFWLSAIFIIWKTG